MVEEEWCVRGLPVLGGCWSRASLSAPQFAATVKLRSAFPGSGWTDP